MWVSFCFLANSNFELGRGNNISDWHPTLIPGLENKCITQIACGGYHSLALTGIHLKFSYFPIFNEKRVLSDIQFLIQTKERYFHGVMEDMASWVILSSKINKFPLSSRL